VKDRLDHLVARMCERDPEALEQVFLALESELQRWIRRRLRPPLLSRLDASDVILATWVEVLRRFRGPGRGFADMNHFRKFIYVILKNKFIDLVRRQFKEEGLSRSLEDARRGRGSASRDPGPDELAEAGELWERIVGLCPPEHRPILELRRAGYTLNEIAARTGLHPGSIRRILRTLSRRISG
jgi:RNA polymerase sigma-70 factor (ECF subfamily)